MMIRNALFIPAIAGAAILTGSHDRHVRASTVDVREWTVPWEHSRPRDPYVAPDGKVWFVGQQGNYIANLDPTTGAFTRYELDEGVHPHNLIVDARGHVWYAGNRAAHIGRLDPASGAITKYPMPDPAARDPHTLIFDGKGTIWFTVQGGNRVGRLDMAAGRVTLLSVPTRNARPYGIKLDSRGHPWIALFGTHKLATIDPATMQLEEIALPDSGTRPRRLEITRDDVLWYVDFVEGELGRFDIATRTATERPMPDGARSRPYGTALDARGRLWMVETGLDPNMVVGFDTRAGTFLDGAPIPSGGGTVRHMYFHRPTDTVWFGTDVNTIGRITLP